MLVFFVLPLLLGCLRRPRSPGKAELQNRKDIANIEAVNQERELQNRKDIASIEVSSRERIAHMQFQRDIYLAAYAASSRDTTRVPRLTAPPYGLAPSPLALEFPADIALIVSSSDGDATGSPDSSNTD
ncbi:hypothetical protein B0T25DRAFT_627981 [Lasiosphaeria hispida]|uniref:Uncharacterized protein n=1 Tax=Lasiosphaeria hispida TaxID=260671 RepID=A0AAJ0HWX4_9PEZI|nr:hypothetical protein B0T25DRAFT_627981 [Lasiosphaeria hispida]